MNMTLLRKEQELDNSGRPSLSEWVESGKSILEYPTGLGKLVGDLTRQDLMQLVKVQRTMADLHAKRASVLAEAITRKARSPDLVVSDWCCSSAPGHLVR